MLRLVIVASILIVAMLSGCSMCCERWYETYGGYGGSWERVDPEHGRVGSAFYDAGTKVERAEQGAAEAPEPADAELPPPPPSRPGGS